MMGTGNHSSESPEMVPLISEDEITPALAPALAPALTSVRVDAANGAPPADAANGAPPADAADPPSDRASSYGATDAKPKKGKKDKAAKEKSGQKAVSDALKTDMAAERTFFKWLWTGLHTGAIGSFIFVTFDADKSDRMRIVIVGFAWLVAFMLVLYGTMVYYRRRLALRTGDIEAVPQFTREHSPLVVVVALALVVGAALSYAAFGERKVDPGAAGAVAGALGGA